MNNSKPTVLRPLQLNALRYFDQGAVAIIETSVGVAVYNRKGIESLLVAYKGDFEVVRLLEGILTQINHTNAHELPDLSKDEVTGQGVDQSALDF